MTIAPTMLCCILAIASGTPAPGAERRIEQDVPGDGGMLQVSVVLLVALPMSTSALATMRAEAEQIWSRHGIRIQWRTPAGPVDAAGDLVVLLSRPSNRCPTLRRSPGPTLGCFPTHQTGRALPVVIVFPEHVRLVIRGAVTRRCQPCPQGWFEQRIATALGRALAHELGHYLLGPHHTKTGLMRASYRPRDLLAPDLRAFSLTDEEIASLRGPRAPRTRAGK